MYLSNLQFIHVLLLMFQDFTLRSPCACPVVSGICEAYDTEKNSDPGVVGILLMCL